MIVIQMTKGFLLVYVGANLLSKKLFCFTCGFQHQNMTKYSRLLKGALCKNCVIFPLVPGTTQVVLGSFMSRPFLRFEDIHQDCENHATTILHLQATAAPKAFIKDVPFDVELQNSHYKLREENRKIKIPIISCVIFCGTHDIPLRGKEQDEGILLNLINMRIDAGETNLKNHVGKCRWNAIYTSPRIQNKLITICGTVTRSNKISEVRESYSVLAYETAGKIRREFVGFIELKAPDASTISKHIDEFLVNHELIPENCVGFGFDDCSTMAGKEGGV